MAKRKKLIITREGYLFLAAVGVLLLALIIVAFATKGFGACSGNKAVEASASPAASEYHPAPTAAPTDTPEPVETPEEETPAPDTPDPSATDTPEPTVVLSDDPNALLEPTAEMIAGAAEGKLTKSGVNMRQGPSTNTSIIATGLKSGTKLTVYAEDGDFYFLLVNETKKYGYIAKKFVKLLSALGETSTGSDQPEGTIKGNITSSNLALREGPGVTNKSLGQYYEGKLVYIFHQEGDYYYVQVAGTDAKGYMSAQFIKPESEVPKKDS
ncbi:MAG: SH3 domain-containing protein [Clostridia bacterium]|nr:SH3 domain-containing protein [Clostridia bacterium]MBR0357597.1 SH3 domain-containing protein [Clostridia bacterium]